MRVRAGRGAFGRMDMGRRFFSLENGRDRADHGGGAEHKNGHFQGAGKYGINHTHDLRPEGSYLALWLLY